MSDHTTVRHLVTVMAGLALIGLLAGAAPAVAEEILHETTAASAPADAAHGDEGAHGEHETPSIIATLPFVTILLCIALLPLIHKTEHWWHKNQLHPRPYRWQKYRCLHHRPRT